MAVKSVQYKQHTFSISYEILNPSAHYDIIFLHGWGSHKNLMKHAFGAHLKQFRHIYIDMPGFGNSTCNMSLTTEDYATILETFISMIEADKMIILGHSFGGKVATLLNPDLLVLVASAGILVPKPFKIRAKIALFKLLKFTGLTSLRRFFVAPDAQGLSQPMYETFKQVVNEDFSEKFSAYTGKALLCFGRQDTATPLWTAYKIRELIPESKVVEFDGDHYFFLEQSASVAKEIENTILKSLEH
ncbi:MAG: 2-hydroxy-6-oxohepta-2,4-dienoate hydrolase [Sulfuricurvum sp. GWF2_44_89]|uniref:2-hydroxy-6-oxohepta-2,4-dienoate hydrolase n=1 Tax=Sulfuricurvum kujiense TaxID=148813 RepID=A0A2D3WK25_9BACT|nr:MULTISPECIES: alpha/beta hydrolase [Sulfuricurvum]OHD77908.1 MAG: 2-hydroxy-6-oxohepta-2,4-dienoate hydrolase [Sulfuricurvum sp. GWF2_44_89]OHD91124.1 MAG: 2-hydroxy-6-oxohepta-2,4-dienoate hydrolase [Sulfuricurvum sp. RIFOXYD12_FULL_44_77]OHD92984.1 MAG: 2-hydroxy-6-oxohepta-2,4-dienoate hydrolase [Sulfuricurvum sp. RIFOXYD2_FULL_44_160]DAB39087.1 MAG TPA: 2-hydroxy-6-oxohepta-2,4-dienoate hydrolase [Sulfuricurvum kujiense]